MSPFDIYAAILFPLSFLLIMLPASDRFPRVLGFILCTATTFTLTVDFVCNQIAH